ncbi:hypothetical protein [Kineococcus rhizosphaerae]|uniref:Uncharacterized protein n=1 Tax=Kineococcus rhizosphaerae TaxID=559628 RepID=A0A2T0QZV0_9ACTN|nr:hypothetical protein [Kineococcus rhizosphaerae]PRY12191.1 hypothetical protein CLV37_111148 [Kineococcus rhizosphaerae]
MAELDGEHPWSDDDAGRVSALERRVAPLRTAAGTTTSLAVLCVAVGAFLLDRAESTVDVSLWPGVVVTALGLVLVLCAGFSVTAYWTCRVLLGPERE